MDEFFRDIFLAFVRIHLLYHAADKPFYGLEMMAELARHGYALGPGTLYPILHNMETRGLLRCERRVVDGKVRKYYRATDEGYHALQQLRPRIRELAGEVMEETPSGITQGTIEEGEPR